MNWLNKAQYGRSRNFHVLRLTSLTYTDMRSDLTDSRVSVTSDTTSRSRKKLARHLRITFERRNVHVHINHLLFFIARILSLKKKTNKQKNTQINDIALVLFKFVFGRNVIAFDLCSTLGERNT